MEEAIDEEDKISNKLDYFSLSSEFYPKTSDHTLDSLKALDYEQLHLYMDKRHIKEEQELIQSYRMYSFSLWISELDSGFNLILYGFGSKKKLIENFASSCLYQHATLIVNGFMPETNAKKILSTICREVLGCEQNFSSLSEQCAFLSSHYYLFPPKLYVIIHNIDGPSLRTIQSQLALSILATISKVRIVASVDHLNAGNLWGVSIKSRFNWIWHNVTTYEEHITEMSFQELLIRGSDASDSTGVVSLQSLRYVLSSMTENAREIFKLLALHQLDNSRENGLPYRLLYDKCRQKLLVSTESALKAYLSEFHDHKVILSRRTDESMVFFIPSTLSVLKQLMEDIETMKSNNG